MLKSFIAKEQGIAATEKNVPNRRVFFEVPNLLLEIGMKVITSCVTDQARTSAIAAIRRATVGHKKQNAIRVTMDQPRNRGMGILAARVRHFPGCRASFFDPRNDLPANRAIFIRRIN